MTLSPDDAIMKRLSMQNALNKTGSMFFPKGTGMETRLGQVLGDDRRSTNRNKPPPNTFRQLGRNSYGPSRQPGKNILDPDAWATWFAGEGTTQSRYK